MRYEVIAPWHQEASALPKKPVVPDYAFSFFEPERIPAIAAMDVREISSRMALEEKAIQYLHELVATGRMADAQAVIARRGGTSDLLESIRPRWRQALQAMITDFTPPEEIARTVHAFQELGFTTLSPLTPLRLHRYFETDAVLSMVPDKRPTSDALEEYIDWLNKRKVSPEAPEGAAISIVDWRRDFSYAGMGIAGGCDWVDVIRPDRHIVQTHYSYLHPTLKIACIPSMFNQVPRTELVQQIMGMIMPS